ncbi:MAG: HAD family phosphatase [Chloroflexi bacterium]|nr:MAG: hypothetical protein CUN54_06695 [Phototrophicales bacterium]RMF80494.1 MAG: HAD family phosphatase [Chloroflexota bacterium]
MQKTFPCPPKAIIFDMDGLLVDSERLWTIAETQLLAARGKQYDTNIHSAFIGLSLESLLANVREAYQLEDDVATLEDELHERVMALLRAGVTVKPGANEIVDFVVQHNIPHAIASNSSEQVIEATLSTITWAHVFAIRCSVDHVEYGKPAPDIYQFAAEKVGIDPADCLALEDSVNGVRAAVAAGMTCFAVPDLSHTTPDKFNDVTPHVFNDLHEALAQIHPCF